MTFFKSVEVGEKPFPSLALRCSLPILLGGRTSRCLPSKTLRSLRSLPSFCLLTRLVFYRKPVGLLPSFAKRNSYNFNFSCMIKTAKSRALITPILPHFYPSLQGFALLPTFCLLAKLAFLFACANKKHKNSRIYCRFSLRCETAFLN